MTELFNKSNYTKRRRHLRKTMPKGEYMLWQALRNRAHTYKFRRQYGIGPYTVDLYCPKFKLAIEVDGLSHFTEAQQQKDKVRQQYIEDRGITVLRFTSRQVFNELYDVIGKIMFTCEMLQQSLSAPNP